MKTVFLSFFNGSIQKSLFQKMNIASPGHTVAVYVEGKSFVGLKLKRISVYIMLISLLYQRNRSNMGGWVLSGMVDRVFLLDSVETVILRNDIFEIEPKPIRCLNSWFNQEISRWIRPSFSAVGSGSGCTVQKI